MIDWVYDRIANRSVDCPQVSPADVQLFSEFSSALRCGITRPN